MRRRWRHVCRQVVVAGCVGKGLLLCILTIFPSFPLLISYRHSLPEVPSSRDLYMSAFPNWSALYADLHVLSLYHHPHTRSLRFVLALNLSAVFHRQLTCTCHFRTPQLKLYKPATLHMSPDHHDYDGRTLGAGILSCPLPHPRTLTNTHQVTLHCRRQPNENTTSAQITSSLPAMLHLPPNWRNGQGPLLNSKASIVHCGAPIHSDFSDVVMVVEFVEHHRLLGVSHFVWYVLDASAEVERVIAWYADQGLITVLRWHLPFDHAHIHYFGQGVALSDCLLRAAYMHVDFVLTLDLDELIWLRAGLTSLLLQQSAKDPISTRTSESLFNYVLLRTLRASVVRAGGGDGDSSAAADQSSSSVGLSSRRPVEAFQCLAPLATASDRSRTKYLVRTLLADTNAGIHKLEDSTLSLHAPPPTRALILHLGPSTLMPSLAPLPRIVPNKLATFNRRVADVLAALGHPRKP